MMSEANDMLQALAWKIYNLEDRRYWRIYYARILAIVDAQASSIVRGLSLLSPLEERQLAVLV